MIGNKLLQIKIESVPFISLALNIQCLVYMSFDKTMYYLERLKSVSQKWSLIPVLLTGAYTSIGVVLHVAILKNIHTIIMMELIFTND